MSAGASRWALLAIAALLSCSRTGLQLPVPQELCEQRCSDGVLCNGVETCDERGVCVPGPPETCEDEDECTIDLCDAEADLCRNTPTPRDDDADGWGACDGDCDDENDAVFPGAEETCDMVDEDCDGIVDETLRSECGDCRLGCRLVRLPPPMDEWRPTGDNSTGVEVDGVGALVLSSQSEQRFDAWIANDEDGLVTRLDTRNGLQLAQYHSVLAGDDNDAPAPGERCGDGELGNCPSRTAVDLRGAVYVANRAFDAQGSVTKIAGFLDDCVDRDGSGTIETSSDLSGNGTIDLNVEGEFLGQDDECLLWTVNVGSINSIPRAVAVAADGNVWVGLYGESRVIELDPSDGHELSSVPVPGFDPYGAAIDGSARLWLTEPLSGKILSIDTETGKAGTAKTAPSPQRGCPSSYGIVVDASGIVWIAGFTCPYAFGYDPVEDSWRSVPLPDGGVTRGIAADDRGRVYVAASHDSLEIGENQSGNFLTAVPQNGLARLTVFNGLDGSDVRTFGTLQDPLPGQSVIGVGLDHARRAWLIGQYSGTATLVDPDTGDFEAYAVGTSPYTYSDFTGFALRRLFTRSGEIREVVEGCMMGPSEWERVTWDADMPTGSRIELRLRSADTPEGLGVAPWVGPFDGMPVDLLAQGNDVGEGRYLEVEISLISGASGGTPALREVVFQLFCPV